MQRSEQTVRKKWTRASVSSLEADVAYFDARLALLDEEAVSYYQLAQLRAYRELKRVLSEVVGRLRAEPKTTSDTSGIEVTEEMDSPSHDDRPAETRDPGL